MYASYLNRARLLQRHNRCDDAFKDFDNAIQASPEIGEIYYSRAYCWMQKGDKKRALEDVKHAQTLGFVQMDPAFVRALQIP
jgi:tetratricopeptide (TPR) repeat protein